MDHGSATRPTLNYPMPAPDNPTPRPPQVIPRPELHRPGSPAPWATLSPEARRCISLDRVRQAIATGDPVHLEGHPRREPWPAPPAGMVERRPAAVLVALFEERGEARVILTVRSSELRSHTGEVAFPGGRLDGDEGVVAGALREASEEVGLDPALVTVVGTLTAMPTVSSNTVMTPVVATLGHRPSLRANPGEVERIFDVALADLVADHVFEEELWAIPGRMNDAGLPRGEFPVWFFEVAGEMVWGATARTLVELVCLVLGVPAPSPLRAG
jgi:8-oxo-dGTP pyrophosphatase MutT (NUDIX family)